MKNIFLKLINVTYGADVGATYPIKILKNQIRRIIIL